VGVLVGVLMAVGVAVAMTVAVAVTVIMRVLCSRRLDVEPSYTVSRYNSPAHHVKTKH